MFTKHIDCGDFVIVINADQTVVTGKKNEDKMYYHHSQYPGGLTELRFKEVMVKDPTKALTAAVRGMLPVNKLRPERLQRLKVYAGSEHNHAAQQPITVSVKEGK
jgi:large subunit ribosomal protein L13